METGPDSTAVRTALWRALHVLADSPPAVLDDTVGLRLVAPPAGWRDRGDMHPHGTRGFRAAIVSRARFIEDLVAAEVHRGVDQYVILGAGLDSFVQRRAEFADRLQVFEIDQAATQRWKRRRLEEEGFGVAPWLHFVPVDFEAGERWWDGLVSAGFDPRRPAVVASTGVLMYLTKAAAAGTFAQLAGLAPGSTVAITFMLPAELLDPDDRAGLEASAKGAKSSGTPFVSFYTPDEIVAMARAAGFAEVEHIASPVLAERYFAGRSDGLRPSTGEDFVVVRT